MQQPGPDHRPDLLNVDQERVDETDAALSRVMRRSYAHVGDKLISLEGLELLLEKLQARVPNMKGGLPLTRKTVLDEGEKHRPGLNPNMRWNPWTLISLFLVLGGVLYAAKVQRDVAALDRTLHDFLSGEVLRLEGELGLSRDLILDDINLRQQHDH